MRVLVVRHHDIDSAGLIGDAFEARGGSLTVHQVPDDGQLPDPSDFAHVIVLGCKWSVYDETAVGGWIDEELAWLRKADQAGVPVLGICFGAQALAAAFGGRVEPAGRLELGWTMVQPSGDGLVAAGPWFQFHGDRFVPPPGARLLARNDVGVQAITIGRHLGVQFHPEVDEPQLRRWIDDEGTQAIKDAGLDPAELLAQTAAEEPAARLRAGQLVAAALRIAAA